MTHEDDPPATPHAPRPAPQAPPPDDARVPWGVLDSGAVFLLVVVTAIGLMIGVQAVVRAGMLPEFAGTASAIIVFGAGLLLVTLGYVALRYRGAVRRLRGEAMGGWADVGLGVGLGIAAWVVIAVGVGLVLRVLLGEDLPELQQEVREAAQHPELRVYLLIGAVFIAPIAEEVFFRGMLFQALRDRVGLWPGVGLSAAAFSLVHLEVGGAADANLLLFVVIFPVGVLLALLFHWRRRLLGPIVLHMVFNAVQITGMMLIDG